MANSIVKQTIVDGSRNLVMHVHIDGDGTGDESNTLFIDASSYSPAFTEAKLMRVEGALVGFTASLAWDATTNVDLIVVPDYDFDADFHRMGGITNNAGVGKTGNVLISTTGLGAGDHGYILLEFKKKNNV